VPPTAGRANSRDGRRRLPRLYAELAALWPLISPVEDYAGEADVLAEVIRSELGLKRSRRAAPRPRVLELGAGGGHTLHHLRAGFDMTAVDLSPGMLAACRRLNPDVPTFVGDMRSVRLPATMVPDGGFDAVLIHDAIDYMRSPRDVTRTLATVRAHLRPGGVLVIAPTYVRETFRNHDHEADQHSDGRTTVTYLSHIHDADPDDTRYELRLTFLIERRGRVRQIDDRHTCGLFSVSNWVQLLGNAGFDARAADDPSTALPHVLLVGRMQS
jgi:SAM-dependent methyltransferase